VSAARAAGVDAAMLKRLVLDAGKLRALREGLRALERMPDPLGVETLVRELSPGLCLRRATCALGVVCVVFESRPEAVVQIAALCVKAGCAVILKGGKEAAASNAALGACVADALAAAALPRDAAQLVASREALAALLAHDALIDLVIPRGSAALVRAVKAATRIPVLGHADGICHVYVAASADARVAARVAHGSKVDYPAACNAAEVLLLDADAPARVVDAVADALLRAGVSLHACRDSKPALLAARARAAAAPREDDAAPLGAVLDADEAADFDTEWLSMDMSVRRVAGVAAAAAWVNAHGSHHTDAICVDATADAATADAFLRLVDSAGVFVNAATRFADGFRFGFGAEVGVSTGRIHSRGPVGLDGLLTYRYTLVGEGHVVAQFSHEPGQADVCVAGQRLPALDYTHKTLSGR
jgi:glutamate-5-semialdehyde dehydrogenase